jgi:hypothetical protein
MSRKRFTAEQIIGKLREAEVALAQRQKRRGRFAVPWASPNRLFIAGAGSTVV